MSTTTTTPDATAAPEHLVDACTAALAALEQAHGTAALDRALKRYDADPGFYARRNGVDPERMIRDINACLRGFCDPEAEAFADNMVDKARALPVAEPFPGVATTSRRAAYLLALEELLGTAGLEHAITAWQCDKDVRARRNFLHKAEDDQATLDALKRMRSYGSNELADEIEADWKANPEPMAEPLPGLLGGAR